MKRKYVIAVAILIVILTALWAHNFYRKRLPAIPFPTDPRAQTGLSVIPVTLPDGTRISAEVARTFNQVSKGLMYRDVVPPQTGMLMVYSDEQYRQIWMKNVKIDLDIIFIDENKKITHIAKNLKKSPEQIADEDVSRVTGYGKYVLELASGEAERLKLKKGMQLVFL